MATADRIAPLAKAHRACSEGLHLPSVSGLSSHLGICASPC